MLIHINACPGVGKLTIAQALAPMHGARLLDNHSIYNVAFALTEYKSPEYYETIRAVRAIAYNRLLELPPMLPVILTNAHFQSSKWGNECWDAAINLAKRRGCPHFVIVLACSEKENARRIQSIGRAAKRKPRDPAFFTGDSQGRQLLDRGGDETLRLDVTHYSAEEAAQEIAVWLASFAISSQESKADDPHNR
jgi:predicted kinase